MALVDHPTLNQLEPKKTAKKTVVGSSQPDQIPCPKCKTGTILKGKTAYGCSAYKAGCDFVYSFENIKKKAKGLPLTTELVLEILQKPL